MSRTRRVLPFILNTGLMLALAGAVLLTSCAKNSGFENSPAVQARMKPAPSETARPPLNKAEPADMGPQAPKEQKDVSAETGTSPAPSQGSEVAAPSTPEISTNPAAPTPSTTPTPAPAPVTTAKQPPVKLKIQARPSQPEEFQPPQGSSTFNSINAGQQKFIDTYQEIEEQRQNNPTARDVIETYPLAWESVRYPHRKSWSRYTYQVIEQNFAKLDQAQDAVLFCHNYQLLETKYKRIFWAMLISQIAYHESSWNPTSRALEGGLGTDEVTKLPVYSEGLMQLSYQDTRWNSYCKFDWSKDQVLGSKDPRRTILNPYINLACGIRILANQVERHQKIVMKSNVYWAVLREGGKFSKVEPMVAAIQKRLPFCH